MKKIAIVLTLAVLAVAMVGCGETAQQTSGASYNQEYGGGSFK